MAQAAGRRSPRVVWIVGAGIGGLSVAHELSKRPDEFEVHIVEASNRIGGLASTLGDEDGCAMEYCWRVYFWFYFNLKRILAEIPLTDRPSQTVLDNLVTYKNRILFRRKTHGPPQIKESLQLASRVLDFTTSCDERAATTDKWVWRDRVGARGQELAWETVPQWLGLDKYHASFYSVARVGFEQMNFGTRLQDAQYVNHSMNQPTSEGWFAHWRPHLERNGNVHFHMRTRVSRLQARQVDGDHGRLRIESIQLEGADGESIVIDTTSATSAGGDNACVVLSLGINQLDDLLQNSSRSLQQDPELGKIRALTSLSQFTQLSFQVHFDRPIFLDKPSSETNGFILQASAWSIIIETREVTWTHPLQPRIAMCSELPGVRGSWSVLAGQPDVPGILFGKPFVQCSQAEIHAELWAQILDNRDLLNAVAKHNDGFDLRASGSRHIVKWSPIWPDFHRDSQSGAWINDQTKFSNNAGTLRLRPRCVIPSVDNLFLSTAFAKQAVDIYSMEGAARSGLYVAARLQRPPKQCSKVQRAPLFLTEARERPIPAYFQPRAPLTFEPLRVFDALMFRHHLPNVGPAILTLLIVLVVALVMGAINDRDKQVNVYAIGLFLVLLLFSILVFMAWRSSQNVPTPLLPSGDSSFLNSTQNLFSARSA
jgi:hypothetical protein